MVTPSSTTRIVTRAQTLITDNNSNISNNIPMSNSEKGVTKSRPRTGALTDITNDSPIVGLAMGKLETPSSAISKKNTNPQSKDKCTSGSGESLLRSQVKTLLQKVDEELSDCLAVQEELMVSQEGFESDKNVLTRSLLFDFSEKSEGFDSLVCSSVLTNEGENIHVKTDDDSSAWSLQVNTSAGDDYDEVEDFEDGVEEDEYYDYGCEEEADVDGGLLEELCEGISKINVNGAKFEGKHTRFLYNSDGEIDGEEECKLENEESSSIVRLKGLPTPKGKHSRFSEDN